MAANLLKYRGLAKGLSLSDYADISKGEIKQATIAKILKNQNPNELLSHLDKLNITPDSIHIDKIKEVVSKINLDDVQKEKLKFIGNKLNFSTEDVDGIIENVGKDASNEKISINEVISIVGNGNGNGNGEGNGEMMNLEEVIKKEPKKILENLELPKIKNLENAEKLRKLTVIIKKYEKGSDITLAEKDRYEGTLLELKNIKDDDEDKEPIDTYISKLTDIFDIENDANLSETNLIIIEFKKYAEMFRLCLIIMITISFIIYIIIVLLSSINVLYLTFKIFYSIFSLFYNSDSTNGETLSYSAKKIANISVDKYKNDMFNIISEQQTALTIFSTVLYIIYVLMAYVITYLLCVMFSQLYKFTHVFRGSLSDIDSKYLLITIIAVLFIFSFIHLLIYKFLFKKFAYVEFRKINETENEIDNKINAIISPETNNNNEFYNFYSLLTDTSKRNEIDKIFSDKIKTLKTDSDNQLRKYIMIYDIYMYFEEYLPMNDVMKEKIGSYFGIKSEDSNKDQPEKPKFIELLDSNERKLMKAYHEDLEFHNLISADNLEYYLKVNDDVSTTIAFINKHIIKYTGTFFPFLITCIYIYLICIYNIYTLYIVCKYIIDTEDDNIFMTFIYNFSHKYIYYCEKLYSTFF